jgi:hypothetical protein
VNGKTDWGLPDWTLKAGYPAPRGPKEMTIWAWEFLRRNPEYRVFWKEKIEPFIDMTGGDLPPHKELKARVVPGGIYRDAAGTFWPYLDELRTRFGVENPSPPQSTTPSHFTTTYISWVQNEGGDNQRISLERHQVAYIFDLTRPLKRQFEMAEKSATREQEYRQESGAVNLKNSRNRDAEKYVLYLRILDADEAGARSEDIGDRLFPDKQNDYPDMMRAQALYDNRKAARKLRDGGHRSLLDLK